MVKISELEKYDAADVLETPEDRASYLSAALEDGNPVIIRKALQAVARSIGMKAVAEAAEVSRESLYRSLGEKGNPEFSTVLKVMKAMGIGLAAIPISAEQAPSEAA
ncbi:MULTISPECIES: addiction module antidote protein [unclassified Aureimonas]|uniref:addiction module antidote protein n=1 Tax=unclassified Aureimonas TaxID=2615206 RepID=UPI00071FFFB2|nr:MULTISPECIES: addiction module antidote protein [unclassified Aureimonas]ALN75655.1 hypothetical protein M673_23200 [Aureimonas sp. AU20]